MARRKRKIKIDMTGQRIGHWSVIGLSRKRTPRGGVLWRCKCDCGKNKLVWGVSLRNGESKTCGCKRGYNLPAWCRRQTLTRNSYSAMLGRCTYPKNVDWHNYGGRGITVCERWRGERGMLNFCTDMGPRPAGKTLDRINVNGNYEPGNCRWATPAEQAANKRPRTADDEVAADCGFGE